MKDEKEKKSLLDFDPLAKSRFTSAIKNMSDIQIKKQLDQAIGNLYK